MRDLEEEHAEFEKKQSEDKQALEYLGSVVEKETIKAFEQKAVIDTLEAENAQLQKILEATK